MHDSRSRFGRFLSELRRRKVPQTGAGYAVVAWVLLQIGEVTFEPLHFPDWVLTVLIIVVIAGFPVVLVVSWFFDLTFRGFIRDTGESDSTQHADALAPAGENGGQQAPAGPSVAVLSFADMSPQKDQEYLCDGIAEEILNRLAQVKALSVASRTSSFGFKVQPADIATIGRQLKVSSVLEGSVRKSGNKLRVTTQLVNAADGFRLWSKSYDRDLQDIFEIQDEIASNVAAALEVALTGPPAADPTTRDVKAYDYFLRGQHYFRRWGLRNVKFAIDMFNKAVHEDRDYALGWAALSDCHAMICMYWDATAKHLQGSAEASQRAIELAPELAEAHVSRGLTKYVNGMHHQAIAEFEHALTLDPGLFSAYYFYGRVSFQLGKLEQAARLFEQAERAQPDDFQAPIFLRQIYNSLGRSKDALDAARRGVVLAERHLQLNPDDTRALNLGLGGLALLGEKKKLLEWTRRSLAIDGDNPDTLYNVACGYAVIGETQRAMDCLERAALRGTSIAEWAEQDSDLDSLRQHPQYSALIRKLKQAGSGEHTDPDDQSPAS